MTSNNIESVEATFVETTESTVIVEISSQTDALVEIEMAGESDEVKRETKALIEALKRRAQAEADSAGTLTRETYLNAVRRARELVEGRKLIEGNRLQLENALAVFQDEAQRNWHLMMKDLVDFNYRLQKAAKAAWEAFNHPYSQN
ncbi:hypothetical protein VF14_07920 [Nostoc linckia z18]|uniref:Uncharacterized protein n=2 Tax=Nostoc linckia TaxID=92942 RepID=A0A9Q6EMJ2_NOSLI|nr:hypothetical protein [Nostoc linckia]PHK34145.1 hypothetical protein VF12_24280 [Nostoc linckia z15]PHK47216.1 hypothetical protein VF13_06810 [Nostoc linckia z16]PHJ63917.1 hypothetical protein VF02_14080 [Nostoc linckia z1]PHJ69487.1 hypothetical protein VF05_13715 [Nostoc linckia z3]PHJ74770.1 hypothetical protein VF03_13160 [Nostoc linckia z2]